jgi:hypothetical protein
MAIARRVPALFLALALACYAHHERDAASGDAGAERDADAGRLCGCPGSPTARVCVLPLMCCPATLTCEDPASFRCTGSTPSCG